MYLHAFSCEAGLASYAFLLRKLLRENPVPYFPDRWLEYWKSWYFVPKIFRTCWILWCLGYEVIVLSWLPTSWPFSWWAWLLVGVILMMLVTCATRAALGAVGVIAEDRPVRWKLYCFLFSPLRLVRLPGKLYQVDGPCALCVGRCLQLLLGLSIRRSAPTSKEGKQEGWFSIFPVFNLAK